MLSNEAIRARDEEKVTLLAERHHLRL